MVLMGTQTALLANRSDNLNVVTLGESIEYRMA
jgi:hypothetical protein